MPQYLWELDDWPDFTWRGEALMEGLSRVRFRQGDLLGRVAHLSRDLGVEARCEVLASEAFQTSSIEGIDLDWETVRSSVSRRLRIDRPGPSPVDAYTEGIVQVLLDATERFHEPLTLERLHGWQRALFPSGHSGLARIPVGEFRIKDPMRVVSGPIGRERIHYEAPPSARVPREMARFLQWWNESRGKLDGLLRAGIAGFHFVTIHPYADGNGRLSRAVTEMALAQDENLPVRYYSVSTQIRRERESYYEILERCQKGTMDLTDWLVWFLACLERTIEHSEEQIGHVLRKALFWKEHQRTPLTEKQHKVVNRLLDASPGGFEGDLTTRKYVGLAKTSRATAYREIRDLVEKGILAPAPGGGRSARYRIEWPPEGDVRSLFR